jgi:hypothetical protein
VKNRATIIANLRENYAAALARVRIWEGRAAKARHDGRASDAERCDDKVRDWASRARQIERQQKAEG